MYQDCQKEQRIIFAFNIDPGCSEIFYFGRFVVSGQELEEIHSYIRSLESPDQVPCHCWKLKVKRPKN